MYNLKFYIAKRLEIVAKSRGVTRLFAYGELICFPISVGVIGIVAVHSLLVLLMPLFAKIGMPLAIPTVLPSWLHRNTDAVLSGGRGGYCGGWRWNGNMPPYR